MIEAIQVHGLIETSGPKKRRGFFQICLALICMFSCLWIAISSAVAATKIYRWVDDNGLVHYSDTLPQSYAAREHKIYDENIILREEVAAPPSAEELERQLRQQRLKELQAQASAEQAQKDRQILSSYMSEAHILRDKTNKMEALKESINDAKKIILRLNSEKRELQKKIKNNQHNGGPVPEKWIDRLEIIESRKDESGRFINHQLSEMEFLEIHYDNLQQRFNEALMRTGMK